MGDILYSIVLLRQQLIAKNRLFILDFYILKEFEYYHNDYDGYVIDTFNYTVIKAFDSLDFAKTTWIYKERSAFCDIGDTCYEKISDDCLDWINKTLNQNFDNFNDFVYEFEKNPAYFVTIKKLSDDDFMTLLDKMNGHRFGVDLIHKEELNKERFGLDLYDGMDDKYYPYCPNSYYTDNAAPLLVDSKDVFFNNEKMNNHIHYLIQYERMFCGQNCLTDDDLNNPELNIILEEFADVFEIDNNDLLFTGIEQNQIDALHKVNSLLKKPFFKITTHRYLDLLTTHTKGFKQ